jgi:hypothetical protein
MNDIKEKEPIVPLATLLLSRESEQTDGQMTKRQKHFVSQKVWET